MSSSELNYLPLSVLYHVVDALMRVELKAWHKVASSALAMAIVETYLCKWTSRSETVVIVELGLTELLRQRCGQNALKGLSPNVIKSQPGGQAFALLASFHLVNMPGESGAG